MIFFFYLIQEKFNFVYDAESHLGAFNLILREIDREAVDIYHDWKYDMHKAYRNSMAIGGYARARQQKPRAVHIMD